MVAYAPDSQTPIENALQWVEALLLGTIATSVAIIAVATVGFMMMTGRLEWRRGATTLVGCFILFGAREIASGLQTAATGWSDDSIEQSPTIYQLPPPPVLVPPSPPTKPQPPEVQL